MVNKNVLLAGLKQLVAKYRNKQVPDIGVQIVQGKPAYVMQGPSTTPPPGLPGSFSLPDESGHITIIPILWFFHSETAGNKPRPVPKPVETDLDKAMWYGFTPVNRRDTVIEYQPGQGSIVTQQAPPEASVSPLQVAVDIELASDSGWWEKVFDVQGCLCCTYYARPTTILRYVVPQDYCLTIDGWSFFVNTAVPTGWTFHVRFSRDGDTLLEYDEVVVDPANPDPAKRCLFSGSIEQVMQSYLRIDRNQTLMITITPKGLFPFLNTSLEPFCGNICILMHGHLTALLDNRDGAPRPKDIGRLRDDVWGDGELYNVTAADVCQLLRWLNGATADAVPVIDGSGLNTASMDIVGSSVAAPPVIETKKPQEEPKKATTSTAATVIAAIIAAKMLSGEESGSSLSPDPFA